MNQNSAESLSNLSGDASRRLARAVFNETQGRSVSRIIADNNNTDVGTVHKWMTVLTVLFLLARRSPRRDW